jgi:hypothetical protein
MARDFWRTCMEGRGYTVREDFFRGVSPCPRCIGGRSGGSHPLGQSREGLDGVAASETALCLLCS